MNTCDECTIPNVLFLTLYNDPSNDPPSYTSLHYLPTPPPPLLIFLVSQLMKDPVLFMADGQTYNRANIEKWVGKKGTSPFTKEHVAVSMRQYFPNVALKMTIATFIH